MRNRKACGASFASSDASTELCITCTRALKRLGKYVAPVKYGHYGFVGGCADSVHLLFGTCSECKTRVAWYKGHNNYCPNCGARMKEDGKDG